MPDTTGSGYYSGKTLLITGATGFVGKVLIETVLRKLPDVRKVHVLIRRAPAERVLHEEIVGSSAFDFLRAHHGDGFDAFVRERLAAVEGDLARDGLGLNEADRARLGAEVDVVINSGALAVFDARLDHAFQTNTLGPGRVLEFARQAAKRPFVAHVSTCYVNNRAGPVFEVPLDEAFDVDGEVRAIAARIEALRAGPDADRQLVQAGLDWAHRRGCFDTYTLTKSLGERLFMRHRGDIPGLVLRPSIIESALRVPAPGWIDGFRMADPIVIGYARRQIFDFPGNPETVLDLVPADTVVNALLMAIPWSHSGRGADIYQVASGTENPLYLKSVCHYIRDHFERTPLRRTRGTGTTALPPLTLPPLKRFLRHLDYRLLLPLRLQEALLKPLSRTAWGKRRRATLAARRARVERLRNTAAIYGPYTECRARFLTFNLRPLWQALSADDRARFPFRLAELDWKRYLHEVHLPGVERYLLRMPRDIATPAAALDEAVQAPQAPRWDKAEKLLSETRQVSANEAFAWTTPLYKKGIQRASNRAVNLICKHRFELECAGQEHLPERGPFIVVANHTSHVDTGVLLAALGPLATKVHPTAAADYWFRSPVTAWVLHATLGAIPFDRRSRNIARALSLPAQVLRNGHSLIFYPEGSRSPDGRLRPFRSTVGLLALASGAPIVPARITGAAGALAKGDRFIRHHPVKVRFGPPIDIARHLVRLDRETVAGVARGLAGDAHAAVGSLH